MDKSVQTGEEIVDRTVVKYSDDNIVTITVHGNDICGEQTVIPDGLAIVAHNTLRLRIIPGKEYDYYQEISEDGDSYDYCDKEETPPPLPPRHFVYQESRNNSNSFETNTETIDETRPSDYQRHRKDLKKYFGLDPESCQWEKNSKKDLSKFLGVEKKQLEKAMISRTLRKTYPSLNIPVTDASGGEGSEGYSSADLSFSSSGSCTTSLEYYAACGGLS